MDIAGIIDIITRNLEYTPELAGILKLFKSAKDDRELSLLIQIFTYIETTKINTMLDSCHKELQCLHQILDKNNDELMDMNKKLQDVREKLALLSVKTDL